MIRLTPTIYHTYYISLIPENNTKEEEENIVIEWCTHYSIYIDG